MSLKMSRQTIYLIYSMNNKIIVSELLALKDCMKILFFNMQIVKINLLENAYIVINENTVFKKSSNSDQRSIWLYEKVYKIV